MSGQIAQELQNNPQAMQRIAPLIQSALSQVQQQPMQQPMQAMGMSNMGYNPFMAIQQMQRQPAQAQNPFFGGSIPMQFGLPQINQVPAGYVSPLAGFRPGDFAEFKKDNSNNGMSYNDMSSGQDMLNSEGA